MTSTSTGAEPIALVAELWFEQAPDLTDPELLAALRALSPDAEAQQDSITVPYAGPTGDGQVDGGPPPLVTVVMPSTPLGESGKQRPDVSQTWDWEGAEAAVARADGRGARDRAAGSRLVGPRTG